jgi:hypothetical protein
MTPKKEPRLTPLQSALGHLLNRVEDLERKPAPAQPTLEELFLDRSAEATRLLGDFVYDHAPVPPAPPDRSLQNWLSMVVIVGLVLGVVLVESYQRQRTDKLQAELTALEQDVTKLDARAVTPPSSGTASWTSGNLVAAPIAVQPTYLDLDQRCWVKVSDADGLVTFEGYAPPGRLLADYGALKRPVTIRDGCPGHVAFTVDGAPVDPPREPGHDPAKVEVVVLGGATVKPQSYIYIVPEERKPCSGRCA